MKKTSLFRTILTFEFFNSFKSMLIWSFSLSLLSIMMFALYEPISDQTAELTELLKMFPPELLEAFGASAENMLSVQGFYNSKFVSLFVLMNAIYGGFLLQNSFVNELKNGSLGILFTKNISKTKIFFAKIVAKTLLIAISNIINLVVAIFSIIVFTSIDKIPFQYFFVVFSAIFIVQLIFAYLSLILGLSFPKFENLGIIGLTLGAFTIDSVSRLGGVPEFLKFSTPFYYLDLAGIANNSSLSITNFIILLSITLIRLFFARKLFINKEI